MDKKPTYDELKQKVEVLKKEALMRVEPAKEILSEKGEWIEIFQAIGHAALILDVEHNIKMVNEAALKATGSTEKELLSKKCYEVFHNREDAPDGCPVEKIILSGKSEAADIEMEALNGVFLVSCRPVFDKDGELQKIIHIATDITERKQSEKDLRIWKHAIESAIHPIGIADLEGKLIFINDAAIKMWGYDSKDEVLGRFLPEFWEGEGIFNTIEELKERGVAFGENVGKRKDGALFNLEFRASILKDEDGNPEFMYGSFFDISKRKRVEEALRESEGRYITLSEASFEGILVHENGVIIDANQRYVEMFGYDHDELIGTDALKLITQEFRDTVRGYIVSKHEGPYEVLGLRKDSSTFYIEIRARHMLSQDLNVRVAVVRDITEQKHAEEALRKSEERYRALFEDNPIETIVVDKDAYITMYNKAKKASGGGQPRIGDVMYRDYAAGHLIDMHQELMECIKQGKSKDFPDRNYKNRFLDIRMSPFKEGVIITSIDRTEKRKLGIQLRRAQKMESLGLMAGGIAHDLNNILSGIVSLPELLLVNLSQDSPLRNPIETIKESGMRAADVVSDLLTVARGVATSKEVSNLNTLVEDYLGSAEHQRLETMHSFITFKTALDPILLNIFCSSTHIRKSLTNLITNASEAIEGNGTVTISTENRYLDEPLRGYEDVRKGEYVVLAVSDDGPGISKDDLERIFEPFYTKKVMGRSGTGLGLAVVWNTLQDHDGYINVDTSNKGTVFELYLPVTRDEVAVEGNAVHIDDYLGNGEKILVVDDEKRQREIACGILTELGYIAEAASSGEEAVEYLKEQSVDLVVLDMIMPNGINGRETYGRIIKIHPGQKAIVASGYAETSDVKKAQKLGVGKYIKKPYTMEKIGLAVREELEK